MCGHAKGAKYTVSFSAKIHARQSVTTALVSSFIWFQYNPSAVHHMLSLLVGVQPPRDGYYREGELLDCDRPLILMSFHVDKKDL